MCSMGLCLRDVNEVIPITVKILFKRIFALILGSVSSLHIYN